MSDAKTYEYKGVRYESKKALYDALKTPHSYKRFLHRLAKGKNKGISLEDVIESILHAAGNIHQYEYRGVKYGKLRDVYAAANPDIPFEDFYILVNRKRDVEKALGESTINSGHQYEFESV